ASFSRPCSTPAASPVPPKRRACRGRARIACGGGWRVRHSTTPGAMCSPSIGGDSPIHSTARREPSRRRVEVSGGCFGGANRVPKRRAAVARSALGWRGNVASPPRRGRLAGAIDPNRRQSVTRVNFVGVHRSLRAVLWRLVVQNIDGHHRPFLHRRHQRRLIGQPQILCRSQRSDGAVTRQMTWGCFSTCQV
ncbi:MAG: hypothetical protein JWO16_828, partial [Sphingomonas bacterium]|nr:hypothetical protein [Sphingomonas bacterium]